MGFIINFIVVSIVVVLTIDVSEEKVSKIKKLSDSIQYYADELRIYDEKYGIMVWI